MSRSRGERVLGRLLTGPLAFALAGALDVLIVLGMVARYVLRLRRDEIIRRAAARAPRGGPRAA